jgi:hypothetical protein
MKIPADQAPDAFRYQSAALAAVRAVMLAKEAIDERCQVGGDIRECKLALRRMDEAAEQATEHLSGISVPPSMSKVNEELTAAVASLRQAAWADLQGHETGHQALHDQAEALTRLGLAGFEQVNVLMTELLK